MNTQLASFPLDWPKPGEELSAQRFGPFSPQRLKNYAIASGDDNPLHLDEAIAAKAGLGARPVHGMLMLSCFEPAILAWRQDVIIGKLAAKFLRPVFVGQMILVSGRILRSSLGERPELLVRLMARGLNETSASAPNRDLAIVAEATLYFRQDL